MIDTDSPDYNDTNLGPGTVYQTPEEKEIEYLNKTLLETRRARDEAIALVASYDRQDEECGAEFEGVDEVTDVIRILKEQRESLRVELKEIIKTTMGSMSLSHIQSLAKAALVETEWPYNYPICSGCGKSTMNAWNNEDGNWCLKCLAVKLERAAKEVSALSAEVAAFDYSLQVSNGARAMIGQRHCALADALKAILATGPTLEIDHIARQALADFGQSVIEIR